MNYANCYSFAMVILVAKKMLISKQQAMQYTNQIQHDPTS